MLSAEIFFFGCVRPAEQGCLESEGNMVSGDHSVLTGRSAASPAADRAVQIQRLRAALHRRGRGLPELKDSVQESGDGRAVVSTGIPFLDDILPDRGLRRGKLVEWVASEPGSGALLLALSSAGRIQRSAPVVLVDSGDPAGRFYPAAFPAIGLRAEDVLLVRPESRAEALWAMEQILRCPGIGAVVCLMKGLTMREGRRLQRAAERGTAVGMIVRTAPGRQPSIRPDVRVLVTPEHVAEDCAAPFFGRRLEVRCLSARGRFWDRSIRLDFCDETGAVRVAAEFSDSATASRTA